MITPAQIKRLDQVAAEWENRPELHCQIPIAEIYMEAGLMPRLEVPNRPRGWSRFSSEELIIPWVDATGLFYAVKPPIPAAGDLLGFRIGHCVHHVGIALSGGRMVHVFGEHGVKIAACISTPYLKRLANVWRLN